MAFQSTCKLAIFVVTELAKENQKLKDTSKDTEKQEDSSRTQVSAVTKMTHKWQKYY